MQRLGAPFRRVRFTIRKTSPAIEPHCETGITLSNTSAAADWQFAIDVGGTFTDCLATSPDGRRHRLKLPSSAELVRAIEASSTTQRICSSDCQHEPDGFWNGYRLEVRSSDGIVLGASRVARHDALTGQLQLDSHLPHPPQPGQSMALCSSEESPIFGIRYCLGIPLHEKLPPVRLRLGTTLATNALLTRSGAATALVTTMGFADLLHIGYQTRPRLFDLTINKRQPIFATAVEIDERLAADGSVLRPPDRSKVMDNLKALKETGIQSLAICLLHAYLNPQHELLVADIARQIGFENVQLSHRVSPTLGLIDRAETTVADAYLNPILCGYLGRLQASLHDESRIRLMTSSGGLVPPINFTGKDSLLSGPAGGVVGYAQAAKSTGYEQLIGFDMGGTSTDVSRYHGEFDTVYHVEKNGVRFQRPFSGHRDGRSRRRFHLPV